MISESMEKILVTVRQALAGASKGIRGTMFATPLAAGMALTTVLGFIDGAQAQNASSATQPVAVEQDSRLEEIRELGRAQKAAYEYATQCFKHGENCVGILLHIGDDIYIRRDQLAKANNLSVETVEAYMVGKLEENYAAQFAPYGVQVKMFPRANPGTIASGVAFHTNNIVYETKEGLVDMHFSTADAEISNVVSSLRVLHGQ